MRPRRPGPASARSEAPTIPTSPSSKAGPPSNTWGVNRAGNVPAGWTTSTAEYKQGMAWKRDQFAREGKALIEFYDYERTEETLDAALRGRLASAGIVL